MPPSHCKNALQIKIPLGSDSKLLRVVAPVVVTPLIDSNKASTKPKFTSVYKKGTAHKKVNRSHDNTVIINASLREIFKSHANIYEEDFLTWKTCLLFDIIIGNPPFNRYGLIKTPTSSLHKSHDGKTIWRDFIRKSLQLLKPNGYLCFIVPSIWMKPDREGIYNLLTQYKLHFIECFSNTKTNQYFGGRAQTPTCIFLLQKIPRESKYIYNFGVHTKDNFKFKIKNSYIILKNLPI